MQVRLTAAKGSPLFQPQEHSNPQEPSAVHPKPDIRNLRKPNCQAGGKTANQEKPRRPCARRCSSQRCIASGRMPAARPSARSPRLARARLGRSSACLVATMRIMYNSSILPQWCYSKIRRETITMGRVSLLIARFALFFKKV